MDNTVNNEEVILTDKEVKKLSDSLEDYRNENDKLMQQIEEEHKDDDNSNAELEHGTAEMVSDGVPMEIDEDLDFSDLDNLDLNMDDLVAKRLQTNIGDSYQISDEEAVEFANAIMEYKKNKKTPIYHRLPEEVKKMVDKMVEEADSIPKSKKNLYLEYTAKAVVNELVNDAELDALTLDLDKAMKELLPTAEEMYSETNRDYIENKFPEVAESIRAENPDKADNLLAMRQGFIDSYTFDPMYKLLDNSKIIKAIRRCEKTWSRVEEEYAKVAGVCKFNMYPLHELVNGLVSIGYTKLQGYRLITLFVYTYTYDIDYKDEKQINDIYRNSFANYFESNIKSLALSPNLVSEFSKDIKQNLDTIVTRIDTIISDKEAELSNKKKK